MNSGKTPRTPQEYYDTVADWLMQVRGEERRPLKGNRRKVTLSSTAGRIDRQDGSIGGGPGGGTRGGGDGPGGGGGPGGGTGPGGGAGPDGGGGPGGDGPGGGGVLVGGSDGGGVDHHPGGGAIPNGNTPPGGPLGPPPPPVPPPPPPSTSPAHPIDIYIEAPLGFYSAIAAIMESAGGTLPVETDAPPPPPESIAALGFTDMFSNHAIEGYWRIRSGAWVETTSLQCTSVVTGA